MVDTSVQLCTAFSEIFGCRWLSKFLANSCEIYCDCIFPKSKETTIIGTCRNYIKKWLQDIKSIWATILMAGIRSEFQGRWTRSWTKTSKPPRRWSQRATSLEIQLRSPFVSMSCHLSEVVTPSQNGVEGICYLVFESRLIGFTCSFQEYGSRISFYTPLAKSGRPTESHCWWEEGLRGNESWNFHEIFGSEPLVVLLLLLVLTRHCLSQWYWPAT